MLKVHTQKEMNLFKNFRKGDFCYKVAENLNELCSKIGLKADLANDKPGCLTEETSKKYVEGIDQFPLTGFTK
jgi:hypothetical protein